MTHSTASNNMTRATGTDPFPIPVDEREIIEARREETAQHEIEAKPDTDEFVEDADVDQKRQHRDVEYTVEEDGKPRKGLRRLLTRNPSMEFVREVAEMDQQPLNPVDVKRVCPSWNRGLPAEQSGGAKVVLAHRSGAMCGLHVLLRRQNVGPNRAHCKERTNPSALCHTPHCSVLEKTLI